MYGHIRGAFCEIIYEACRAEPGERMPTFPLAGDEWGETSGALDGWLVE